MVTAGTYRKTHFFRDPDKTDALHKGLLKYAAKHRWHLQAWAVFSNHYHFVARSPTTDLNDAESLRVFIADFHQHSAQWINEVDRQQGRKVWHNYWDTRLTYEQSYFARLNYVHQNAVKHGLVPVANQYPWCSAAWFERTATPSMVKTIYGFKIDRIKVLDDF